MITGRPDMIEATDHTPDDGYPEGASPGECVAVDINRHLKRRPLLDESGMCALLREFDRACHGRDAVEIVYMKHSMFYQGATVLAVANADRWCCILLRFGQHIAVFVPDQA